MTTLIATYNPSHQRALDRLRYQLGDVDTAAPLLPDATYEGVLDLQTNDERAAALVLLDGLITKFAQMPKRASTNSGSGAFVVEWQNRLEGWTALRTRLLAEVAAEVATDTAPVARTSSRIGIAPLW